MNQYRLPGQRPTLVQRVVASIVGAVALVSLFFLGLFAWIVIGGIALVGGVALSIWLWRQRRQIEKVRAATEEAMRRAGAQGSKPRGERVIEGEYIVVEKRERRS